MKSCTPLTSRCLFIALVAALAWPQLHAQTAAVSSSEPAAVPTVKLSPFEVNTSRDQGFVAASSLAGGRLASDLVDTPVAYSVQTR